MTRLPHFLPLVLVVFACAPLAAQTYSQPGAAARNPAQGPARQAGPQPAARGTPGQARGIPIIAQGVRQAADEQPIRQPTGTAGSAAPTQNNLITPLAAPAGPQPPAWIPLDKKHEEWVNQVLQYWENRSNKVKALSCQFTKWEYQPTYTANNPNWALRIAKGEIKYAQPDKGKFQVTELRQYAGAPEKQGEEPRYTFVDANYAEHWVCDGKRVFQFDGAKKLVTEQELPAEMQGKAIADGPLPFLFGARAETIRARYWIRGLPQGGNGKYWLEAVPKSIQDARNFRAVTIVLDEKTFLPEMLEVLAPNFDATTNPARETYQFTNHEVTDDSLGPKQLIERLNIFKKAFYAPTTPSGWTKVVQRADGSPVGPAMQGPLEATKPSPPRTRTPR